MTKRNRTARFTRRATRLAWLTLAPVLLAGALPLPAAAQSTSPSILDPASAGATELAGLYRIIFFIAVGVFVLVEGLIIYAPLRFRRRAGADAPAQVHGNTQIEIAWTIAPVVIVAVLTLLSFRTLQATYQPVQSGDTLTINVTGRQWWWEFEYPATSDRVAPVRSATELVVPVGRPVQLFLESEDVIHSFWVPQLAGKLDAVPGQRDGGFGQNNMSFVVDREGRFEGQCAEFCGTQHAGMRFTVVAVPEAEFEAWMADWARPALAPAPGSAEARGLELVTARGCAACHVIDGVEGMVGRLGPDLTHVASRVRLGGGVFDNSAANLTSWIDDPQVLKPGATMPDLGLSPEEIGDVVAYLQSLE